MSTKHRFLQDYASWVTAQVFARGGVADPSTGIIEHSLGAVERAIASGHGVVLEVQRTFDNDAVVFGDATLDRLTELKGEVREYSSARLQAEKLKGSEEMVQSLSSLLLEIGGRTPVLIDARRPPKDPLPLCFAIRRALEGYGGPIGIIALDPRILRWFKQNSRRVARGFVATSGTQGLPWWARNRLWRIWAAWRANPDFLAVDINLLPSPVAEQMRQRLKVPVLAWTVRSEADLATARQHANNYIYAAQPSCQPDMPATQPAHAESPRTLATA